MSFATEKICLSIDVDSDSVQQWWIGMFIYVTIINLFFFLKIQNKNDQGRGAKYLYWQTASTEAYFKAPEMFCGSFRKAYFFISLKLPLLDF